MPKFAVRLLSLVLLSACLSVRAEPDTDKIITHLASERLNYFQRLSLDQQKEYAGLIRYLSLISGKPEEVQNARNIAREYGEYAAVFNLSLLSAFYGKTYYGDDANRWTYACPPVFWDLHYVQINAPEAASEMVSDYLLAFANSDSDIRNEAVWSSYYDVLSSLRRNLWEHRRPDARKNESPALQNEVDVLNVCLIARQAPEFIASRISQYISSAMGDDRRSLQLAALPLTGNSILQTTTLPEAIDANARFQRLVSSGLKIRRLNSKDVDYVFFKLLRFRTFWVGNKRPSREEDIEFIINLVYGDGERR